MTNDSQYQVISELQYVTTGGVSDIWFASDLFPQMKNPIWQYSVFLLLQIWLEACCVNPVLDTGCRIYMSDLQNSLLWINLKNPRLWEHVDKFNSDRETLTFERFGYKVCCGFVLLHVVPLHDSALLVQSQVPGPTRGLLPVQHGGVGDVVVLKHRLLELTLGGEVFLQGGKCGRN